MIEINLKVFYASGKYCFLVIATMGIASLIDKFKELSGADIVSKISTIVFQFMIMGMFIYMAKQQNKPVATDGEMKAMGEALTKIQEEKNAKID